jgi:hypothetical protein
MTKFNWFRPSNRGGDGFNYEDRRDIQYLIRKVQYMSDIISRLRADVAAQTSVIASNNVLLSGLAQRIRDANDDNDQDELDAIADELEQNTTSLSQAVVANTPADPAAGAVPGNVAPEGAVQSQQTSAAEPTTSPSVDSSEAQPSTDTASDTTGQ